MTRLRAPLTPADMFARCLFLTLFLIFFPLTPTTLANTEKTVFLAPETVNVPYLSPSFNDLRLYSLTPSDNVLRLQLPRAFPSSTHPQGLQSWSVLGNLAPGQRYELRTCWAATEPTEVWLETHPVKHVLDTPSLITDLATFSESQDYDAQPALAPVFQYHNLAFTGDISLLFLRIYTAADYFTVNETLMRHPPPVLVDISQ